MKSVLLSQAVSHFGLFWLVFLLSACQSLPHRSITEQELITKHQSFLRSYQSDIQTISEKTKLRIKQEYSHKQTSNIDNQQSYDILVLSGGGAFGAFGAGFLQGWGQVKEKRFKRPQFDSVSGISTGALIAPFAFIGTQAAYSKIIDLYENPESDWVRKEGIFPYLPTKISVYDTAKLRQTIATVISKELMSSIAKQGSKDRQLLIGATNIDLGLLRVWDLTKIASESSAEEAKEKTVSILSASSSLPGLFPPVEIDSMYYADGGATMQLVGGMDDRNWAYSEKSTIDFVDPKRPIKIRVWIIINQKLLNDPKVVPPKWTSIAERSLNTLLRASALQSIQDAETFVQLINLRPEINAEMHYVAIPQAFPIVNTDTLFDAKVMRELVKLGLQMGSDPSSWKSEALRPGAPFKQQ